MQNNDSQIIVCRFFDALARLKQHKLIRGKKTFTDRYGINRWNMNTLESDPTRGIFQPSWLSYLVRDYRVSALWLLTGEGDFFSKDRDASRVSTESEKRANNVQMQNTLFEEL